MPVVSPWLLVLPFIAGALLPLQTGINGQTARHLSSLMGAAFLSFAIGTLALLCVVLVQRELPALGALKELHWWQWSAGMMGASFLVIATFSGPRIGALLFMGLVLAGQLGMAMLLDHFGWAGYREAPASLGKISGLLLVFAGVWLIQRG